MKYLRKTFRVVVLLLIVIAAAIFFYAWKAQAKLDGEIRTENIGSAVKIRRDAADVTHIEAANVRDAYFALGYVHAQERTWQLEFNRRVMHGELSEVFGAATLDTDRTLRKLGVLRAAQAQWEKLPHEEQQLFQAYVNGINTFNTSSSQALPPEFHILGVKPGRWQPQDSLGWAIMMALDLGGNWGTEFARFSALQKIETAQLWQLVPPYPGEGPISSTDFARVYRELGAFKPVEVKTADAPAMTPTSTSIVASMPDLDAWTKGLGHLEGIGSNNWVVAGTHTQSGKPLLANDPHLGLSAPAIWYFARIKVPAAPGGKPMDVIGATLPGLPSVVLGRTAGVAWGFTNTGPDVQDLYLEQINPRDSRQYRTPDGWAEFQTRRETIRVKGQPDETLVVRTTRHGPVMSDANAGYAEVLDTAKYALALRWGALDADNMTALAGVTANYAQTVDELLTAYAPYHSPMQNLVAADTTGRTAYRAIGKVPKRHPQNDFWGLAPVPGWDAKYDWVGWVAPEGNPNVDDAAIQAKGWLATANQRVQPVSSPDFMGIDWVTPERFDRIEKLLSATPKHTAQTMRDTQADTLSIATLRLLPVLQKTASTHPLAAKAQEQLKAFDGDMKAGASAPVIFAYWADELTRGVIMPKLGEAKFKALYGKRTFRAGLQVMLEDPQAGAFWCGAAGCAEQSSQALGRALDRLSAQQGQDPAAWRWGKVHVAISGHKPFGNVPVLAKFFDVSVVTSGDPWTVNVGQYWPNDPKTPFAARHAASLRAIYDLADPEQSKFVYQTGQSGLVFSPRYRDMRDQWAQVQYRPLQLNPPAWTHELTLAP